jgi:hypothetical protein
MARYKVPPIPVQLIMKANQAIADKQGEGDATVTVVVALGSEYEADDLLAAIYRLTAMQRIVLAGQGPGWVMDRTVEKYKLVNEAMFRAAARTTLRYESTRPISEMAFDTDEFLRNALEDSETTGTA